MIEERYDTPTRIWTTTLGVAIAAIIDWLAIINPGRGLDPTGVHTGWWVLALAFAVIAPAVWTAGRLAVRDFGNAVVWAVVLITVVVAQFVPLAWAQSQS